MLINFLIPIFVLLGVESNPKLLWPKPATFKSGNTTLTLSSSFQFLTTSSNPRLLRALGRFHSVLDNEKWVNVVPTDGRQLNFANQADGADSNGNFANVLNSLTVSIESENLNLDDKTDESYSLDISTQGNKKSTIKANTVYGAMHGLESFVQMVQHNFKSNRKFISHTPISIVDAPTFVHRGLLLDTSRNYYPIKDIKRTIDGLSYTKMNVFHWHIVDSHSWPFQSQSHPLLWQKGTIFPNQIYSYQDIREVVAYGLDRGVRVIPEIEAPAHAYAIGLAYPELGVCMDFDKYNQVAQQPPSGQIDPTNPKSLKVVTDVIDEFKQLFTDKFIHLSGDEVSLNCWNTSEKIREYVKENNVSLEKLFENFATSMHKKATQNNKSIIVWQEILLNHNLPLPKDSLIQVWLGPKDTLKVVEKGYRVIASSYNYWYLDCGRGSPEGATLNNSWCDPYKHWQLIYSYDLLDGLNTEQQKLVAGGEVTAWSEMIDSANLDRLVWPRAAAAAEVLWSGNRDIHGKVVSTKYVLPRLNNFRYRLVSRGIMAEPLQPLWCVVNPNRCDAV